MAHYIIGVEREGGINLKTDDKQGLVLEFTEHYTVISDEPEHIMWVVMRDAVPTAEAAPYLPKNGLPLPQNTVSQDGNCICQNLSGERDPGNPRKWRFTATWSSSVEVGRNLRQDNQDNLEDNPETAIPIRETTFEVVNRSRFSDYLGLPYKNGAGQLFASPIEVEDVLNQWNFSQFEPVYSGNFASPIEVRTDFRVNNFIISPPGVYESNSPTANLIGYTDETIAYFNGALNHVPFRGKAAFTLLLKVRKSTVGYYYGRLRRLTEYTITYDPKNWLSKVANAGPYFIGPKLDAAGNAPQDWWEDFDKQVLYPYIYYTKDEEDEGTDLAVDQAGPLGGLSRIGVILDPTDPRIQQTIDEYVPFPTASPYVYISIIMAQRNTNPEYRWMMGDAQFGSKKVKTASGKYTYRALKPSDSDDFLYLSRLDHYLFDFNRFLRVP